MNITNYQELMYADTSSLHAARGHFVFRAELTIQHREETESKPSNRTMTERTRIKRLFSRMEDTDTSAKEKTNKRKDKMLFKDSPA